MGIPTRGGSSAGEERIPEGTHRARIKLAYEERDGSCLVVKLDLGTLGELTDRIDYARARSRLCALGRAIVQPGDPAELEPERAAGRSCRVRIKHSEGHTRTFVNVTWYLQLQDTARQRDEGRARRSAPGRRESESRGGPGGRDRDRGRRAPF